MKVPERLAARAVSACVYLWPQMLLHYSGSSSASSSLLYEFVNPARERNGGGGGARPSSVYSRVRRCTTHPQTSQQLSDCHEIWCKHARYNEARWLWVWHFWFLTKCLPSGWSAITYSVKFSSKLYHYTWHYATVPETASQSRYRLLV